MAHNDKISLNLPCEGSNLFGRFTSHQLGDRIETERPQSCDTFVEHIYEGIFHLNGCASVGYIRQEQCTGIGEDRQEEYLGAALTCQEGASRSAVRPSTEPS